MENLLALLDKIQQISPLPVLSKEVIIVHNAGMQHWLNLSLAEQRGISMNFDYALPSQYLWRLLRSLASGEQVPKQSPYSREVLTWRIDELLACKKVMDDPSFASVNNYWQQENSFSEQAKLKRFQLATQLADLFEQYLIFRPNWLNNWQQGKFTTAFSDDENQNNDNLTLWQAKLWQFLTEDIAYNPQEIVHSAINNIAKNKHLLPVRLSFFGINSLAPIWLEFISALSEHIEVHFFHLNPCFDYWGDLLSSKQAIKSQQQWLDGALTVEEQLSDLIGNPLLANLGQQGREFLALLQQYSTINIEAFEQAGLASPLENNTKQSISVLQQVQNDILSLTDARTNPQNLIDDSITITSCHSALREVQGLHDWLLHQFNQDSNLTPKDVLVMCPQVENYAPFIDAVFSRGWQQENTQQGISQTPQLPCSIADRVSKDSEPLVAAFIELLQLPDSRFQISKLISLLRLPAMQTKFSMSLDEITKISDWLEQACIHWGLNAKHKKELLDLELTNNKFTWQQGLSRLLLGFAYSDEDTLFQNQLLLGTIEGSDALLLGKLMQIIEQLQFFAQHLSSEKNVRSWLSFLHSLLDELFVFDGEPAFEIIDNALNSLVDFCEEANYHHKISLAVVRDFLQSHFSEPDPGRQFLVGQVTFCSMLPMRSIPFKVIAVLGLNDSDFPRHRQPLGFDLMALTPAKIGDRSRRGDDRYLFLEAIICARTALYLSYQGRNIRNNNDLQPSLVLKELMEYLDLGYGWSLLNENKSLEKKLRENNNKENTSIAQGYIQQLPMQPFSLRNYALNKSDSEQIKQQQSLTYASFDQNWLRLAQSSQSSQSEKAQNNSAHHLVLNEQTFSNKKRAQHTNIIDISLAQLVTFFEHPAKYFAKNQLNLHFEQYQTQLNDTEPFKSEPLASYQLKQQLLFKQLTKHNEKQFNDEIPSENLKKLQNNPLVAAELSGRFPDSPLTAQEFTKWQTDSELLANAITAEINNDIELVTVTLSLVVSGQKINLSAQLPISGQQCVCYRSSSAKAKDLMTLYLYRLFCDVFQTQQVSSNTSIVNQITQTIGWYFDTKNQQVIKKSFTEVDNALAQLEQFLSIYLQGQQQALLVNSGIGERYFNARKFEQTDFEKLWQDPNSFNPLGDDPYMQFFWPSCPLLADYQQPIEQLYQGLYQSLQSEKITSFTGSTL